MIIFSKNVVNVGVLAPREFLRGKLSVGLGSEWTEARLGMYFTGVDAHDENVLGPSGGELVNVDTVADYLTIGLKDAATRNLPGEAGGYFLGVRSKGTVSEATTSQFADSLGLCSAVGYAGSVPIDGGQLTNGAMLYPDPEPITGYNGFYCVRFAISNRGTNIQSVSISVARSGLVTGDDYTKAALYQAINNASFGIARVVPWNTGSVARALPDAAFVRIPFYNYRIRIQEIMAVKTSP